MSTFYSNSIGIFVRPPLNPTTAVDVISNPGSAIDTNTSTFAHVNDDADLSAGTAVDYTFANPLQNADPSVSQPIRVTKIRFKKDRTDDGLVSIGSQTIAWSNSDAFVYVEIDIVDTIFTTLDELVLTLNTQGAASAGIQSKLYDVQIYVDILPALSSDANKPFEFNDSVLSTKAWNSSRYDGKQLNGIAVNQFSASDSSYGNTPVIQNYSNNIYLGSRVIGLGEESGVDDVDDTSLVNFPGFSYVTVHEFITVNTDLSVTRHSVMGDISPKPGRPGTGNRIKKGWYQSWYDDFPIGSDVSLRFFDEKLETSLDSTYNVFFNGGQLKKLLHVRDIDSGSAQTTGSFSAVYLTGSHNLQDHQGTSADAGSRFGSEHRFFIGRADSNSTTADPGGSFTIFNKEDIIDKFFNLSLVSNPLKSTPNQSSLGK